MRLLIQDPLEQGTWEVNWMWLPTFFGVDSHFQNALAKHIETTFASRRTPVGEEEAFLDEVDRAVVDFALNWVPHIEGLKEHLESLLRLKWTDTETKSWKDTEK